MAAPMQEPAYVRAADLVVLFLILEWSLCDGFARSNSCIDSLGTRFKICSFYQSPKYTRENLRTNSATIVSLENLLSFALNFFTNLLKLVKYLYTRKKCYITKP